ncbi:MAG TPA: TAXI family TRAP transporter solute-binding subunit, partial [Nevskiaceae bacterium]
MPEEPNQKDAHRRVRRLRLRVGHGVSWHAVLLSLVPVLVAVGAAAFAIWHFTEAPTRTLTLSSGPVGSVVYTMAEQYVPILKKDGIRLVVLPSKGSSQNLERLVDPHSDVDLALVQGGTQIKQSVADVVSLGSLSYEPIVLFYRGTQHLTQLSQLKGRTIGIGMKGSGTQALAMAFLKANGITGDGDTTLE